MNIESSYDITTTADAWAYFVGSQSVAEWLSFDGPTTVEAIATDYLDAGEATSSLASDDIQERNRIAQLLAQYIESER